MSTINKKPYVKSLFESMSDTDLNTLSTLLDGGGNQTAIRRTMNVPSGDKTKISTDDKGVHLCSLEINYSVFMGYLIYNDDYCCLIWFTDSQVLKCFDINVTKNEIKTINEELNILELRSTLYEAKGGSGGGSGSDWPNFYEVESDVQSLYSHPEILNVLKSGDWVKTGDGISQCVQADDGFCNLHFYRTDGIEQNVFYIDEDTEQWTRDTTEGIFFALQPMFDAESIESVTSSIIGFVYFGAIIDTFEDGMWVVGNWSGEDQCKYLSHTDENNQTITFVRYVYDGDEDTWTFDTSYGIDGYNTISLGGGSGSSALYLHSIYMSYNDGDGKAFDLYLNLTNTSSTAFTKSSLKSFFQTLSSNWFADATGYAVSDRAEGPIQRISKSSTSGLITVDGFMYDNGSLHVSSFMTLIDVTDASVFEDVVNAL